MVVFVEPWSILAGEIRAILRRLVEMLPNAIPALAVLGLTWLAA